MERRQASPRRRAGPTARRRPRAWRPHGLGRGAQHRGEGGGGKPPEPSAGGSASQSRRCSPLRLRLREEKRRTTAAHHMGRAQHFGRIQAHELGHFVSYTFLLIGWSRKSRKKPLRRCRLGGPRCLLPEVEPPGASCSAPANQAAARTRPHWPPPPATRTQNNLADFCFRQIQPPHAEKIPKRKKLNRQGGERKRNRGERRGRREKVREDALRRRRACGRPHRCRRRRHRRGVAGRGHVRAEGRAAVPRRRRIALPLRPDRAVPASRGRSTA